MSATEPEPVDLLARDEVGSHPMVVDELALSSLKGRRPAISLLSAPHLLGSVIAAAAAAGVRCLSATIET